MYDVSFSTFLHALYGLFERVNIDITSPRKIDQPAADEDSTC